MRARNAIWAATLTAALERLGLDIDADPDLVTPKLEALRAYQLSLPAPLPPPGSFDEAAAARGGVESSR